MTWTTTNPLSSAMQSRSVPIDDASDDLIRRLQRGEPAAVGEAYDQHHQAIRAFATRLVGDAELAEDLVQEAFVALPRAMGRFRGDSSLRSFVTGVVVNHARHFVRGASRRRATLQRLAREPVPAAPRPDRAAEDQSFLAALQRAMDALPLDQRVAFVVCEVEGRSAAEAALIAGAPEATMRTRLFHAKKKLQSALEAEGFR
jgi:RNA polymerase sigma-70 factor, ECF subfamily